MGTATRYGIAELATLGGVSRRTVRFYVQEGLIPPPLGLGRGDHYTEQHLEQLLRVKALQEAGRTLDEVRDVVTHDRAPRSAAAEVSEIVTPRSLWRRIELAPGVELHVASTVPLPPLTKLRELTAWCRAQLANGEEDA